MRCWRQATSKASWSVPVCGRSVPRDPNFIRLVATLKRGVLPLVSGGRSIFNPAYVGNLISGLRLAAEAPEAAGKTYLIADAGAPSWREVLEYLGGLLGVDPPRVSVPAWFACTLATAVEQTFRTMTPAQEPPLTRYRASCHGQGRALQSIGSDD